MTALLITRLRPRFGTHHLFVLPVRELALGHRYLHASCNSLLPAVSPSLFLCSPLLLIAISNSSLRTVSISNGRLLDRLDNRLCQIIDALISPVVILHMLAVIILSAQIDSELLTPLFLLFIIMEPQIVH